MKRKIIVVIGVMIYLCLCSCSNRYNNGENNEQSNPFSKKIDSSTGTEDSSQIDIPDPSASFDGESYRFNNIPDFPVPNITPQKLTYYKVMLGETTVLLDTEQIEQAVTLLNEVEIVNTPTKRNSIEWKEDDKLHQVISFYKAPDDEEPEYSLYFFANSLIIEKKGICSDVYPTPNWNNEGVYDETRINDRFRRLIDSWSEPSFPPLR